MNEPVKLVTTKPDKEIAEELKLELVSGAQAWLDACTKAHRAGFIVQAQFGPNYLGQYAIISMNLVKTF